MRSPEVSCAKSIKEPHLNLSAFLSCLDVAIVADSVQLLSSLTASPLLLLHWHLSSLCRAANGAIWSGPASKRVMGPLGFCK